MGEIRKGVRIHVIVHVDLPKNKAILVTVIDLEVMEDLSKKIWLARSQILSREQVLGCRVDVEEIVITQWLAGKAEIEAATFEPTEVTSPSKVVKGEYDDEDDGYNTLDDIEFLNDQEKADDDMSEGKYGKK